VAEASHHPWLEVVAMSTVAVACLLPFAGDVSFWVFFFVLLYPVVYAVGWGVAGHGRLLRFLWGLLFFASVGILVVSFFFTFAEPVPESWDAGFYFERCWGVDLAASLIISFGFLRALQNQTPPRPNR